MQTIDLEEVLETASFGRVGRLVLAMTTLALVFDGFDIQAIAFAAPSLIKEWAITKADLSSVLAWGLGGMALGALVVGEIGDRFGRRSAIIMSLAIIAVGTLFVSRANDLHDLALWRCLAGIGLGGVLPNATSLIVEFANRKTRNLAVAITVVGVPVGGLIGAAFAAQVVPKYGWQVIFVIGAILPMLLVIWALIALPESPRFLAMRRSRGVELAVLMNRVIGSRRFSGNEQWSVLAKDGFRKGFRELFRPEFRYNTIMIWLVFMTNLLTVYSFFNWLPALLSGTGIPLPAAIKGSLYFNLGGVFGAIVGAWLMTRVGSYIVIGGLGGIGILALLSLALLSYGPAAELNLVYGLMIVAGASISGLQVNMFTVCASAYPTHLRATGVGAGLASARLGGIFSAYTGTFLMGFGGGLSAFFNGLAGVLLLTFIASMLLRCHVAPTAHA
jgi:AAHS family 4-hydroxybenzoate transporter-like MFS transporter